LASVWMFAFRSSGLGEVCISPAQALGFRHPAEDILNSNEIPLALTGRVGEKRQMLPSAGKSGLALSHSYESNTSKSSLGLLILANLSLFFSLFIRKESRAMTLRWAPMASSGAAIKKKR
jgi:hypothetical protein